jgi:hypothetical protein
MGLAADRKLFRYGFLTQGGVAIGGRQCFVLANTHTLSLSLGTGPQSRNLEPSPTTPQNILSMILPLASRGGSIHPAARVAVIEFTNELPPGLVTRRQSIVVLLTSRFEFYKIGMVGTFRDLPVRLVNKIDGRPDISGQF